MARSVARCDRGRRARPPRSRPVHELRVVDHRLRPGVDVISNFFDDVDKHDDHNPATADYHGWARWSGTSFAAPIVAAAIAREVSLYGISAQAAADRVVHDKRLFRMPNLGTVVNMH